MKKHLLLALTLVAISALNSTSFAGDAGCGLGSVVIQKNSKLLQLFAITTNGTFFSQAFGITSGTSNCSANGIVFNDKEATVYAEANLQNLKIDMARGSGENLTAFAQILGCTKDVTPAFGEMTQKHYENIFPNADVLPIQFLESIKNEIRSDKTLNSNCLAS
jgi:hypothetical protein